MYTGIEWIDIESLAKSCKGCALVAKAPPIKFNTWLETDLWLCLYMDFTGPHYLITVDSFSKTPEIVRCKKINYRSSNWVSI